MITELEELRESFDRKPLGHLEFLTEPKNAFMPNNTTACFTASGSSKTFIKSLKFNFQTKQKLLMVNKTGRSRNVHSSNVPLLYFLSWDTKLLPPIFRQSPAWSWRLWQLSSPSRHPETPKSREMNPVRMGVQGLPKDYQDWWLWQNFEFFNAFLLCVAPANFVKIF